MNIEPTDALIVVDFQNDFCSGGALPVSGGDQILPIINGLRTRFRVHVYTRDWHPPDHCSFSDAPKFVDGSWPAHCVQGDPGAEFHPDLRVPEDALVVNKGTTSNAEAYSGFDGTALADDLRGHSVTRVFVCGLATDYCVKETALDAVRNGFVTVYIQDASGKIDNPPGTAAQAVEIMKQAGVLICRAEEIG